MKRLFVLAFLLIASPALAEFVRDNCSTLSLSASTKATCFDWTLKKFFSWSGSAWVAVPSMAINPVAPFAEQTQQASNVSNTAGNFTLGHNFQAMGAAILTGIKWSYNGFASKTVKWRITDRGYNNAGTALLDTGTVAVTTAQIYTATFASPITLVFGKFYTVSIYINDGTNYIHITSLTNIIGWASGVGNDVPVGPVIYAHIACFEAGDALPINCSGSDAPPIQLVYQQ